MTTCETPSAAPPGEFTGALGQTGPDTESADACWRGQEPIDSLLASVGEIAVLLDPAGHVLGMNRWLMGLSPEEIAGRPFWETFVAPHEARAAQAAFQQALQQSTPVALEHTPTAEDDLRRQADWSFKALWGPADNVHSVLMTLSQRTPSHGDGQLCSTGPIPSGGSAGGSRDHRSSRRWPYQFHQRIAPIHGTRLPQWDDFFAVECKNISTGGLAFYLGQAPQFETLIVALGRGSDLCHFAARVVRVHQEQRDQGPAYLVGCRFTGRVRL